MTANEEREKDRSLVEALDELAAGREAASRPAEAASPVGAVVDVGRQAIAAPDAPTAPMPTPGAPTSRLPAMRTRLREFAERFDVDVRPVLEPIARTVETVATTADAWAIRSLLPPFRELAHQVKALIDKVAGQQAYVLIFGPLKSGKSTFMNAICSTYVSEVTSLPAYPCIVHVSHGEAPGFMVTRYDGHALELSSRQALHDVIQAAHAELMENIRQVEGRGEAFEPARHMPRAVRRIDVRLPTAALADSGAVLVDTPGLYSRMKFGYDQMTRDFRHAAACAIFIVKTDNLFLEQVFEEFHELLDLFTRVFLIVNLDGTKKDLAPDGTLVPSLERQDPQRIIEAFRSLTLSAPLKAAADAGRLRIYPVDLLHAASRRIRAGSPAQPAAQAGDTAGDGAGESPQAQADFDALLADLTDYLNSNDYLREFLHDSLRRAETLLADLGELTEHEQVRELTAGAASLREQRDEARKRCEAAGRLQNVPWADRSIALGERLQGLARQQAADRRQAAIRACDEEIRKWFDTDASLRRLTEEALGPLVARARDECTGLCREELVNLAGGATAGLSIAGEVLRDLRATEVDLEALSLAAARSVAPAAKLSPLGPAFRTDDIPVKRGFWDWVLLRSKARIRKRLFGPPQSPDQPIAPELKARRLGDEACEAMEAHAQQQVRTALEEVGERLPKRLVEDYAAALAGSLGKALTQVEGDAHELAARVEARLAEAERILGSLRQLAADVGRTSLSVEAIRKRFVPTAPPGPSAPAATRPDRDRRAGDEPIPPVAS